MALLRGKSSVIPSDAVILSEEEAVRYQLKLLRNWENSSEIWPFRYGPAVLSSVSAATGIYLNRHYRSKLKLFSHGRVATYLPICALPACIAYLFHTEVVVPRIILQNSCAICTEMKASAIQAISSCVVPVIISPLSTFPLAVRYATYDVPDITKEPLKVFKLWKSLTKPIGNTLLAIFVGQALIASLVTYFETKSVLRCNEKLIELEEKLVSSEKL